MAACEESIREYTDWLRRRFAVVSGPNPCRIVTPFLRLDGDHIELCIHHFGRHVRVSDGGTVEDYLFMSGLDIDDPTESRQAFIDQILRQFQLHRVEGEVIAESEDVGSAVHRLIQGVLSLEHLVLTARPYVTRAFKEEVGYWLRSTSLQVRSGAEAVFEGRTGLRRFDYVIIGRSIVALHAYSTSSSDYARRLAMEHHFYVTDVRQGGVQIAGAAIIDDKDPREASAWSGEPMSILRTYGHIATMWSEREQFLDAVAAL